MIGVTLPVESTVKVGPKAESRPMYCSARGALLADFEAVESRNCEAPTPAGTIAPVALVDAVDDAADAEDDAADGEGPMLSCAFAESVNALPEAVESAAPRPAC